MPYLLMIHQILSTLASNIWHKGPLDATDDHGEHVNPRASYVFQREVDLSKLVALIKNSSGFDYTTEATEYIRYSANE